ncbi:MAG: hypothetical protein LBV73_16445 [Paraburkholderia sp.]|jgi:hypothetical protein|nr:hypothetical protein [Paraburkholderia sp.]
MDKPLPPVVQGPITPFSPVVRVTGALQGAVVTVQQNGVTLGQASSGSNANLDVPLSRKPLAGQPVTAVQEMGGVTSDPGPYGVTVIDAPQMLPMPTVVSALHTCMADAMADSLFPGATVYVEIGGQPFAKLMAQVCRQWLSIDPQKPIHAGAQLAIWQELDLGGGQLLKSAVFASLPIPAWMRSENGLQPPKLGTPLQACSTSIAFLDVAGGASTSIDNEGMSETYVNPSNAYLGVGSLPLRKGKLVAQQFMRRCGFESAQTTLDVSPPSPPGAPIVIAPTCPDTRRIRLANLVPGAELHFRRRIDTGAGASSFDNYSVLGVGASEQDLDLPDSIPLSDPVHPVLLEFWQQLCGQPGPNTQSAVRAPAAHQNPPVVREPVFDCTRGLHVQGASAGALLQAFDASTNAPLSQLVSAPVADFVLPLWLPLQTGEKVIVRQTGCNASGDSTVVYVKPAPNPLETPVITPPRPGANTVTLARVLPGASVQLLINGIARTPEISVWADPGIVPVPGAALAENDDVLPVQRVCAVRSRYEGRGTRVEKGRLALNVSPSQVTTGTATKVTVSARDAQTGDAVAGMVSVNGKTVGTTGTPFVLSSKAGDPPASGIVSASPGYVDEPFTITLVAPPPPKWTITFHASPKRQFVGSAIFDLSAAHFQVTSDWDGALKSTVQASPATTSAELATTATIDAPPGSSDTVTITAWVDWACSGGSVNGIYVAPSSGPSAKLTFKIAHNASAHHAYVTARPDIADESHYFMNVLFGSISA